MQHLLSNWFIHVLVFSNEILSNQRIFEYEFDITEDSTVKDVGRFITTHREKVTQ